MQFHDPFLLCNYLQLRKYDKNIKWIIVNNDIVELKISGLQEQDSQLSVIAGPKLDHHFGRVSVGVQHSSALKLAASMAKTEFVLILDPDFVVLDWDYILNFCKDQIETSFNFVATPWFVTWFAKKSKSMAPHFVFSRNSLLNDTFPWYPIDMIPSNWLEAYQVEENRVKNFLSKIWLVNLGKKIFLNRRRVNSEFDTLGGTYQMGENKEVFFVDIYATRNQLKNISPHLYYKLGRNVENLIPKSYSYFANTTKILSFQLNSNCENIEHYGTGNYIWGVHMRGFGSGKLMSNDKKSLSDFSEHLSFLTDNRLKLPH